MAPVKRNRIVYATSLALVVFLGLGSRSFLEPILPVWVATYAGDTLWALMVFLILAFVFVHARGLYIALVALAIAFCVEFLQLYQAEWIQVIRGTRVGALALGSGFKVSDLICYSVGVAMGVAGEIIGSVWRGRSRAKYSVDL